MGEGFAERVASALEEILDAIRNMVLLEGVLVWF
jgi:hypothetical protein